MKALRYIINEETVGANRNNVGAVIDRPSRESKNVEAVSDCKVGENFYGAHIIDSEDREILKAVEYCADKSHCTLFRGKSNIDFSNKLITFNLSKLEKDLKPLSNVKMNNEHVRNNKTRWYYLDTDTCLLSIA